MTRLEEVEIFSKLSADNDDVVNRFDSFFFHRTNRNASIEALVERFSSSKKDIFSRKNLDQFDSKIFPIENVNLKFETTKTSPMFVKNGCFCHLME